MNYIKFIAKPNTWFKSGSEVLWEDSKFCSRRPTLEEFNQIIKKDEAFLGIGIRIIENPYSEGGGRIGEERLDGEWCHLDEFEIIEVESDIE